MSGQEPGLRERIAALFRWAPGEEPLHERTPGEIADAVLAEPLVAEFIASLDRRCSCDGDPVECNHEAARGQAEATLSAAQTSAKAQLDAKDRTIEHHNEVANTALKAWQAIKDDAERAEAERDRLRELLRLAEADNAEFSTIAAAQAATVERVRTAIEAERDQVREREAMDGSRPMYDAVLNVCAHIEAALTEPPTLGIRDAALDQAPAEASET